MGELELMFCDETTVQRPTGVEFFLYGGLVVPGSRFEAVCDAVDAARTSIGLKPNEPLKFSGRERPKHVDSAAWTAAKSLLMQLLAPLDLHVFAIFVHESIAKQDEKAHWALDGVCLAFDAHLGASGGQGYVVVDHSKNLGRSDLADVASGTLAVSTFESALARVRGVSFGHVESSLPLQAIDVVLGSLRYCLEKPQHDVSVDLIGALSCFSGVLAKRPWQVKSARYEADYKEFDKDWRDLGARFLSKSAPAAPQ